jgi:heme-degrading monooxygenase HmoA
VIGRVWRGVTFVEDADAYIAHLQCATLPALKAIAGHRASYVLRRESGGRVEFVVITLWDSLDAVRSFAGDDAEAAVVPADARRLLSEYDARAVHYEVTLQQADE